MPLIVHAAWLRSEDPFEEGQLFLWAEDVDAAREELSKQPSTQSAVHIAVQTAATAESNSPQEPKNVTHQRTQDALHSSLRHNAFPADVSLDATPNGEHLAVVTGAQGNDPFHTPANARSAENGAAERHTAQNSAAPVRNGKTPSHPAQSPVNQLRVQLAERIHGLAAEELQPGRATVWLPTRSGVPLSQFQRVTRSSRTTRRQTELDATPISPAAKNVVAENSAFSNGTSGRASSNDHTLFPSGNGNSNGNDTYPHSADPTLELWQISGLSLSPTAALTFLSRLESHAGEWGRVGRGGAWRRLRLGNDLIFWSNAAKHALEILVGQQYLPAITSGANGVFKAVWQPSLLDEHMRNQFEQLVSVMPPVCRAYNAATLSATPTAATLVEHFIASVVDGAIREWTDSASGRSSIMRSGSLAHGNAPAHEGNSVSDAGGATHWLAQLLSKDGQIHLPPQPAFNLYHEWRAWIEQLHIASDTNYRICFELVEPELPDAAWQEDASSSEAASVEISSQKEDALTWTLRYYLQSRDDEETLIPAQRVWQTAGSLRIRETRVDRPQERLLAGLNAASRLFAPIARSIRNPQPEAALLSTDEAYQFLRDAGPLLESSGFGLRLPEWWSENQRARLGLRLQLEPEAWIDASYPAGRENLAAKDAPSLGFGNLIQFSWELSLGGEDLSASDFTELVSKGSPLVRMHDRWIELDPQQTRAAERFLAKPRANGSMTLLQALRVTQRLQSSDDGISGQSLDLSLALPVDITGGESFSELLPLDTLDVQGWLAEALRQLQGKEAPGALEEPDGFTGELRPYQQRGVGWLAYLRKLGLGACLADDMGLGKGVQTIALILHTRNEAAQMGQTLSPALLVCPTSVVANWRRELERFAPSLRVLVHHGNGRLTGETFTNAVPEYDFIITSFGTARRDVDLLLAHVWSDLILDEAQNIKNPAAKQTQAIRRLQAHNRIALTGTPIENRLFELWSIVQFLNPGYLDSQENFRKQYVVPIERYNDGLRMAELRRLIQPFILRRLKSDPAIISDLPEKNEMLVYCSLTNEQQRLYQQVLQQTLNRLEQSEGIKRRGLVLSLLTRLKQICNHPLQYLKHHMEEAQEIGRDSEVAPDMQKLAHRSGKLSRITDMLEEAIAAGDHALIFTQFVEMGELLHKHLTATLGVDVLFLHGGTPARQRDKMVQLFQSSDGPPIFVLSLRAGGYGLNLTRANHVFHFDRWWNPAVENQATDRAFRIGQQRNVQVHKFVSVGTLEERIHELIESKQALAENIVGSGEDWLTELDMDELRNLLTLRGEALGGGPDARVARVQSDGGAK